MENILRDAEDKKFSDFSNAVKQELKTKLANHDTIKDYTSDFDKIQKMKSVFSQINNPEIDKTIDGQNPNEE